VVALVIAATPRLAGGQISPGPLARAHERLEGTLQCVKCHEGGGRKARGQTQMNRLCLDCHKEIAWLSERSRGFHGQVKEQRCASCHPDHAGKEFALIIWPDGGAPERFDHARAGWTLEGRHARAKCGDCHKPGSWVGLETRCTACHEDAHRGALGKNCLKCHGMEQWSPAPRFDHDKTAYPLTGAHDRVTCAGCHASPRLQLASDKRGAPIPRYRPIEHAECSACHSDAHRGALGPTCSRCHTTASFATINRASFDHDRTRYPLRGRHTQVACEKCHSFSAGGAAASKPAFATCSGCHTPDPHAGTATLAGRTVDCASCHSVEGWRPSSYTIAQHRTTRYPLEGKHQQARCSGCHAKTAGAGNVAVVAMRPTTDCVSCHVDPHAKPAARCTDCHDLRGFRPSTVDVAAHAHYGFSLTGAHRAVACAECHTALNRTPAASTLVAVGRWSGQLLGFKVSRVGCAGCHQSAHGTQFASRPDRGACESCHDTDAFRPAKGFDHNRDARFSLKGAHAAVPCDRCHRSAVYRPVSTACEACHR